MLPGATRYLVLKGLIPMDTMTLVPGIQSASTYMPLLLKPEWGRNDIWKAPFTLTKQNNGRLLHRATGVSSTIGPQICIAPSIQRSTRTLKSDSYSCSAFTTVSHSVPSKPPAVSAGAF